MSFNQQQQDEILLLRKLLRVITVEEVDDLGLLRRKGKKTSLTSMLNSELAKKENSSITNDDSTDQSVIVDEVQELDLYEKHNLHCGVHCQHLLGRWAKLGKAHRPARDASLAKSELASTMIQLRKEANKYTNKRPVDIVESYLETAKLAHSGNSVKSDVEDKK